MVHLRFPIARRSSGLPYNGEVSWGSGSRQKLPRILTPEGINDVKLAKKGWVFPPFQKSWTIDISPMNYTFDVQAMSLEKLPFSLPAVFTIGPRDEEESLLKFAKLIASHNMTSEHVSDLLKGIIEGETRVLAAGMTMEEIFKGAEHFKMEVFNKVQTELDQFGLHIYNANIKQLVDHPGQEYFSYLGQKTQAEAANQAKVEVAEAKCKGDIGAKEREGLTLRNAAKVDAETKIFSKVQAGTAMQQEMKVEAETKIFGFKREAEMAEANADLAQKQAEWNKQTRIAEIESQKAASIRSAEMNAVLQQKKALAEVERLRGQALAKATVDYEVSVQTANAAAYNVQKEADAQLYKRQAQAEGFQKEADAYVYRKNKEADAELYAKEKEAEGLLLMAEAQADYVRSVMGAYRGDHHGFLNYLMLDRRVYQEMGQINAEAIQGLEPKVSVWTTGSTGPNVGAAPCNNAADPLAGMYMMFPPLFDQQEQQTNNVLSAPTYRITNTESW
ncbi:hypothetical protein R1flu_004045 [Riccia fluitans]|uniref:Flotillin-like n=1 Tax=Riccia fluitans TaxID=41844 RepID=A0ABD1YP64_9MARC